MTKAKRPIAKRLPSKPSALILVALNDMMKVEKMKGYHIDMSYWHERRDLEDQCQVCFAGSTLACSPKISRGVRLEPYMFSKSTQRKLTALNFFREGSISSGLAVVGKARPADVPARLAVAEYGVNAIQFKTDMFKLALTLEAAGL